MTAGNAPESMRVERDGCTEDRVGSRHCGKGTNTAVEVTRDRDDRQ